MKTVWFQEMHPYPVQKVEAKLSSDRTMAKTMLERLVRSNIVRRVRNKRDSELLLEETSKLISGDEKYVVFKFVGIVLVGDVVVRCYPKYIYDVSQIKGKFKKILAVICKYNYKEQHIWLADPCNIEHNANISMLSIVMAIIQQYYNNGIYFNLKRSREINGSGEVDWDATIENTRPVIQNNCPFYPEMYTKVTRYNTTDFFSRLHKSILAEYFSILSKAELADMFKIQENFFYDEKLESLGSKEYVLYRLQQEMRMQFVTQKRIILRLLYMYISQKGAGGTSENISFFGTGTFNLLWEKVCSTVFDSCLNIPVCSLNKLHLELRKKYPYGQKTLLELIERPTWKINTINEPFDSDTLKPDMIGLNGSINDVQFTIYDAKYYNFQVENHRILGQPGIESITKQYLYHVAYQKFLQYFGIKKIKNIFLFPSDGEDDVSLGMVRFSMLANITKCDIDAVKLSADKMYDCYLNNRMKILPISGPLFGIDKEIR